MVFHGLFVNANQIRQIIMYLRVILQQRLWRGFGKCNTFFKIPMHLPVLTHLNPYRLTEQPALFWQLSSRYNIQLQFGKGKMVCYVLY